MRHKTYGYYTPNDYNLDKKIKEFKQHFITYIEDKKNVKKDKE